MPDIWIRRAYVKPGRSDGQRILIDRLWPRGVAAMRVCLEKGRVTFVYGAKDEKHNNAVALIAWFEKHDRN